MTIPEDSHPEPCASLRMATNLHAGDHILVEMTAHWLPIIHLAQQAGKRDVHLTFPGRSTLSIAKTELLLSRSIEQQIDLTTILTTATAGGNR